MEDNYNEQWIGRCRTLVEVWWKIIIVNSGLGGVGRWWGVWWRFGGRYSNEWIGWCWTLRLVEVW